MVLPLDTLWFAILILFLAVFCLAPLISAPVWWALILLVIAIGLVLTIVSVVSKKRIENKQSNNKSSKTA